MSVLRSAIPAIAIALLFAGPAAAQSAGSMTYGVMNGIAPAPVAPQPAPPAAPVLAPAGVAYPQQGYAATPSYVDCNNPYYAQYCQAYAAWYDQYYGAYTGDYTHPYYDYSYCDYGYPVGVGFSFFDRGRFHHGFDHHGFGHSAGMFHGGNFHGGGFHGGGGGHGGGGSHR